MYYTLSTTNAIGIVHLRITAERVVVIGPLNSRKRLLLVLCVVISLIKGGECSRRLGASKEIVLLGAFHSATFRGQEKLCRQTVGKRIIFTKTTAN